MGGGLPQPRIPGRERFSPSRPGKNRASRSVVFSGNQSPENSNYLRAQDRLSLAGIQRRRPRRQFENGDRTSERTGPSRRRLILLRNRARGVHPAALVPELRGQAPDGENAQATALAAPFPGAVHGT